MFHESIKALVGYIPTGAFFFINHSVQEKLLQEKQLSLFEQQFEAIKGQTEILQEKLKELQETYNELQHKKILLASRANVAQSIKQIQKASSSFQTDNILKGVARAEDRVLLMESEVQAGNLFANAHECSIAVDCYGYCLDFIFPMSPKN